MTKPRRCMPVAILLFGLLVVARSASTYKYASTATYLASRNLQQVSDGEGSDTLAIEVEDSPTDPGMYCGNAASPSQTIASPR